MSQNTSSSNLGRKVKGKIGGELNQIIPLEALGNKLPPHSVEAERAVIGAVMIDGTAAGKVIEMLDPESFYKEAHKMIFETIVEMFEKRIEIDALTLTEGLRKKKILEAVGGAYYLADIEDGTTSSANVVQYARIIQEKFLKRQLIRIAGKIMVDSYDESTDALEEVDKAESDIFKIAQKRFYKSYSNIKDVAHDTIEKISALIEKGSKGLTGVPSGFVDLDRLTGGFQKSDFIVIAGRPSMGKTALALSIARNAAVEYKKAVAFFSIEMSNEQLVIRLLSSEAKIDGNKVRTGNISQSDFAKIAKTIGNIADSPIVIDDSPALSVMELRAKARRLISEYGIQMIMVDYLQLMKSPRAESREREISMISQSLKQLAKELDIPIIALAQLNRGVESRNDKRPMLSDLRESGSIEQDSDVVCFIHRPEFYGIKSFGDENNTDTEGKAEIILSKQRNGPTGSVKLAYTSQYARFDNLALGYQEPPEDLGPPPGEASYQNFDEEEQPF